jgi:DnaJ-class molecular chaperone
MSDQSLADPGFWPCLECEGKGKVRHEEDRDVIEGYKLAPWHTCTHCNGTGRWLKAQVKEVYSRIVREFRAKLAHWKEQEALRKSAFQKLTKEEVAALGL